MAETNSATSPAAEINVEVAYALPQRQEVIRLKLAAGSTLQQAVERSRLLDKYPEIDLAKAKLGIFGKLSKADVVLRDRDRGNLPPPDCRSQGGSQAACRRGQGDEEGRRQRGMIPP